MTPIKILSDMTDELVKMAEYMQCEIDALRQSQKPPYRESGLQQVNYFDFSPIIAVNAADFENSRNVAQANLGQMTDIMNNEVREMLVAKEEFLQWLRKFAKPRENDIDGALAAWAIGGTDITLNATHITITPNGFYTNRWDYGTFAYQEWEQAVEKIIEVSKMLDKNSLFHRIFK